MKSSLMHRSALTGGLILAVCTAFLSPAGPTQADDGQKNDNGPGQPVHVNLGATDLPETGR